jgi:hypothetical protein
MTEGDALNYQKITFLPGNQIQSTATKEVQRLEHSYDRDYDLMQLEETIMIEAAPVEPRE